MSESPPPTLWQAPNQSESIVTSPQSSCLKPVPARRLSLSQATAAAVCTPVTTLFPATPAVTASCAAAAAAAAATGTASGSSAASFERSIHQPKSRPQLNSVAAALPCAKQVLTSDVRIPRIPHVFASGPLSALTPQLTANNCSSVAASPVAGRATASALQVPSDRDGLSVSLPLYATDPHVHENMPTGFLDGHHAHTSLAVTASASPTFVSLFSPAASPIPASNGRNHGASSPSYAQPIKGIASLRPHSASVASYVDAIASGAASGADIVDEEADEGPNTRRLRLAAESEERDARRRLASKRAAAAAAASGIGSLDGGSGHAVSSMHAGSVPDDNTGTVEFRGTSLSRSVANELRRAASRNSRAKNSSSPSASSSKLPLQPRLARPGTPTTPDSDDSGAAGGSAMSSLTFGLRRRRVQFVAHSSPLLDSSSSPRPTASPVSTSFSSPSIPSLSLACNDAAHGTYGLANADAATSTNSSADCGGGGTAVPPSPSARPPKSALKHRVPQRDPLWERFASTAPMSASSGDLLSLSNDDAGRRHHGLAHTDMNSIDDQNAVSEDEHSSILEFGHYDRDTDSSASSSPFSSRSSSRASSDAGSVDFRQELLRRRAVLSVLQPAHALSSSSSISSIRTQTPPASVPMDLMRFPHNHLSKNSKASNSPTPPLMHASLASRAPAPPSLATSSASAMLSPALPSPLSAFAASAIGAGTNTAPVTSSPASSPVSRLLAVSTQRASSISDASASTLPFPFQSSKPASHVSSSNTSRVDAVRHRSLAAFRLGNAAALAGSSTAASGLRLSGPSHYGYSDGRYQAGHL